MTCDVCLGAQLTATYECACGFFVTVLHSCQKCGAGLQEPSIAELVSRHFRESHGGFPSSG